MSAMNLLDQLLKSAGQVVGQGMGGATGGMGGMGPGGAAPRGAGESHLGKYATGAAAGGALALLLGSRRGRRYGGKALKVGSIAAIGALAYKVWDQYQRNQAAGGAVAAAPASAAGAPQGRAAPADAPPTAAPLRALPPAVAPSAFTPPSEEERRSRAMLKAMIAAAKSDGHIDERERGLVEAEIGRLSDVRDDRSLRSFVEAELRRPLEPADVAAEATTPQQAAELYLASLLVADETTTMERAYLDALARALRLPTDVQRELEAQAVAA
jgi:uncharacterized membrane protein YebE (DUF533 family)